MTTTTASMPRPNWFLRGQTWLDERGKGAWIAVMVLGFIVFWPIGLAVLGYMLLTKRFAGCPGRGARTEFSRFATGMTGSTGNAAFDAYRNETLRRLEDERQSFETFLDRLREARDKAEFDQFMEERAKTSGERESSAEGTEAQLPERA
ncbi:DUF2852 domain-containing protein [Roseicyclus sp. F158]|uniref:DUF2852 domain-containing protein n=1 Tax=Tropicimonas omnivorans TaxID=3075590 RepID=A0ABU3DJ48_9RHOB|nr:DUF2852 domain-containing protein [Roseicyclus sp. F158]MDT0683752.1 DUF2852 domain-containing protein [Roseicyclus sp. F158]